MSDGIVYNPSKTCREFMRDESFFRLICGPVGGGKSTVCIMEVLRRCIEMPPMSDGIRRSRWAIVRNTKQQLKDTTLKSFYETFPFSLYSWKEQDATLTLKFHDVHAELLFRSLDSPEDVVRLLSLQLTGAFIDECREIPITLLPDLMGRLRRFPRKQDVPVYWSGLICATNPPEIDSPWFKIMENIPLEDGNENSRMGASVYKQPSGLSPEAENLENLHETYYQDLAKGKTEDWVNVYIHGQYAMSQDGIPVYSKAFKMDRHVSKVPLVYDAALPVIIGQDTARQPASVFMQVTRDGRIHVLAEACGFDMGAQTFIPMKLRPVLRNFMYGASLIIVGDPSWVRQNDTDDNSWFKEMQKQFPRVEGHKCMAASTNDPTARINVLDGVLRTWPDGEPMILIDPSCKMLIEGLRSKYRYTRVKTTDGRFRDVPDKNNWSHVVEACQYGLLHATSKSYKPVTYDMRTSFVLPQTTVHKVADTYAGY